MGYQVGMHNKGLVVFDWIIVACLEYFINPTTTLLYLWPSNTCPLWYL